MGYLGEFAIKTFLSNLLHYTIKKKSFYTFVHPLITIMTYAYDYINEEEKKRREERRDISIYEESEEHFCHLVIYINIYKIIHICCNNVYENTRAYGYTVARSRTCNVRVHTRTRWTRISFSVVTVCLPLPSLIEQPRSPCTRNFVSPADQIFFAPFARSPFQL